MIVGLDHIAIAVPDLEKAIAQLRDDFGLVYDGSSPAPEHQTNTAFFSVGSPKIELISPMDGQGPVQSFLEKRKGVHHISLLSDDIDADVAKLKAKGYQFLTDDPNQGAHDSRVIFIHPRCCFGVLVEISQPAPAAE